VVVDRLFHNNGRLVEVVVDPLTGDASLTQALQALGIRHEPGGSGLYKRRLYRGDEHIGDFTASEGWELVRRLTAPPAEDLTPEGIQLVIPGAERVLPPTAKQGELW
jgi:hypothetical protein